jgi:hypothetical protein
VARPAPWTKHRRDACATITLELIEAVTHGAVAHP